MTAVYGISVGVDALWLVRTDTDAIAADTVSFDKKAVEFDRSPSYADIADIVDVIGRAGDDSPTVIVATRFDTGRVVDEGGSAFVVVDESTAAIEYLDYTLPSEDYTTCALVDIGATGCSVTYIDLETGDRTDTVRSTVIAGAAHDDAVSGHLVRAGIVSEPGSFDADRELRTFSRSVKESLSTTVRAVASGGTVELLTRSGLDELITGSIRDAAAHVADVGARAGLTPDVIVVIGGVARVPAVSSVLQSALGVTVVVPDEPETVTAKGASLVAAAVEDDTVDPPARIPWLSERPAEPPVAESKPVEAKPAEKTSAEQKPVEAKPAEQKPVEAKPAEQKPAEAKPAVNKPAGTKPADTKPTAAKTVPAAASGATPKPEPEPPPATPASADDRPAEAPTERMSAPILSPFDSPTAPFVPVDSEPDSARAGAGADAVSGSSGSDASESDAGSDSSEDRTADAPPTSMRLPRIAATVLTVLAVASGVLWAIVRPGADLQSATAAVTDAAAVTTTQLSTTQLTTTLTTTQPVTTTAPRTTTSTTDAEAGTDEIVEDETPDFVPPRTFTRTSTAEVPVDVPSSAQTTPDVVPTLTPTTRQNPFPLPPIFEQLPIPGF